MALALKRICSGFRHITRSIMTTSVNLEKALENIQQNPYYEKYADRIAALQKTSPEEFMKRVEENQKGKETKKNKCTIETRQFSSILNPKEDLKEELTVKDKLLSEIFKVELVKDKDASEVQAIWEEYHKNKEVISATIPTELFTDIQNKMKKYSTFIFPLPRSQGYEFVICQNYGQTVHFTPLLAFQVHKENAPECLTIVHYTELHNKGLVLMRGEYDKNVLNGQEAQCLANQFQMYYSGKDLAKLELLQKFTESPDSFKHIELITQLENMTLV